MPDDRVIHSLYDQDLDAWSTSQAAILRAVRGAGHDQLAEALRLLDWDNLAEEIEAVGKRDRRELGRRIALIIEHLLKLAFSSHAAPRAGWIETVLRERDEIAELLRDSPSLRGEVPGLVQRRSGGAINRAAEALGRHGETLDTMTARLGLGYHPDEILGDWLPES